MIAVEFAHPVGWFELLRQGLAAVAAIRGQHGDNLTYAFERFQLAAPSGMALLSARLAPASAVRRFQSPHGGGPVGGGRRAPRVWRSW